MKAAIECLVITQYLNYFPHSYEIFPVREHTTDVVTVRLFPITLPWRCGE